MRENEREGEKEKENIIHHVYKKQTWVYSFDVNWYLFLKDNEPTVK